VSDVLSVLRERGVIPYAEKGNIGNKKSDDITRYKIVRPNDIVVNCMNVIIGSVGLSKYTGCLSPVYYVLTRRTAEDEPGYLNAYFQTRPFQQSLVRIGNGILAHRMRIPMELLKCEPFPRPPAPEQAAIVRFLDHADRRIRRYIRAKQKLIKLLEEQKQAIIHRAVTRGLDPNVRLKPSGVEWLGDVPEHWDVRRLKTLCGMRSGDGITGMSIEPAGDYPVYGGNGVRGYTSSYTHDGEFALIGRQGALCGNVHLARGRFWASEHAVVASLRSGHILDWFGAILLVMNLNQYSIAAAQPGLAVERVLNLWLPVPPTAEQAGIADQIEHETAGIGTAMDRAHREIDLLREYRTRLIADVATGKLDVREAAALLPDEAEEPEPLDGIEAEGDTDEAGADDADEVPEEAEA
jgi:type I restriction enzyme S subunit